MNMIKFEYTNIKLSNQECSYTQNIFSNVSSVNVCDIWINIRLANFNLVRLSSTICTHLSEDK